MTDLYVRDGRGQYRKASPNQVIEKAIEETRAIFKERATLNVTSPRRAIKMMTPYMSNLEREHFVVMYLDNRHHVLRIETMHMGSVSGAQVFTRETVKRALEENATAIIVAHNHPSGGTSPSRNDLTVTDRIKKGLDTVDIRLLDHIIFAGGEHASLSDQGVL